MGTGLLGQAGYLQGLKMSNKAWHSLAFGKNVVTTMAVTCVSSADSCL